MNSTIIADQNYINEINEHILGIENKTDKFYQKHREKFEHITYNCFMQAVLQIKSQNKTTIDGAIIELDTMYYNKTGKITDIDKYVIALAHMTVNYFLSLSSSEISITPLCHDKETNKHYAKVLLD